MGSMKSGKTKGAGRKRTYVFGTEKLTRYRFPTHCADLVMDRAESACSEVFVVVIEPRKATPLHQHSDMEQIFYLLSGHGTLTIGRPGRRMAVKAGDVVRVPANTWHSMGAGARRALRYLSVDCFGSGRRAEAAWDEHIQNVCKEQKWDFGNVVNPGGGGSTAQ